VQKGKKKSFIQNDIKEIFLSLFHKSLHQDPETYITLKISDIKDDRKTYWDKIDRLSIEEADKYHFPEKHL